MNQHDVVQIAGGIVILAVLFIIDRVRKGRRGQRQANVLGLRREPGFDQQPESGLRPERIVPVYQN